MAGISVVILSFNSREHVKRCLDSLVKQQHEDVEVVVVDNGSKDGTPDFIKFNYPKARLILNEKNLGAAKARNQGIEAVSGKWILTLDCDVVLEDGFIKKIVGFANSLEDSIGMIQPKILSQDDKKIYSAGIRISFLKRFHDIAKGMTDVEKFNIPVPVYGACCAAALYRRKMLEEAKDNYGYFDERLFFLFEDADLSWRAQKKGWICRYYPVAKCYHYGNSSFTDKKSRQFLSFRNRQLMILKNQNLLVTLLMIPLYLVYDLPRFLILAFKFKCRFPKI